MDKTLGYSKHERNDATDNSRNGYNDKKVKTSLWEVELDIPRNRKGTFEPQVISKYSRDISDIEDKIISMYERGMSTTDINNHLKEINGMSFSPPQISRITDKIMEEAIKAIYPDTKVQRCIVHQIRNTLRQYFQQMTPFKKFFIWPLKTC